MDLRNPDLASKVQIIDPGEHLPTLDQFNQPSNHGSHVAGIIAADFHNKKLGNGATPFANVLSTSRLPENIGPRRWPAAESTADEMIYAARRLLEAPQSGLLRVFNFSYGYNWLSIRGDFNSCGQVTVIRGSSPNFFDENRRIVLDELGKLALNVANTLAARPSPIFIVTSAGNDSVRPAETASGVVVASTWNDIQARWNNPFCHAALVGGARNVYCVGSIGKTADKAVLTRAPFSNVNGTISAPGESIGSTSWCRTPACENADGFTHDSGTSMASPLVAGLIAHLLAYKSDLTVTQVYDAVVGTARASGDPLIAPGIDALKAMLTIPGAKKDLLDVDDGSADGNDLSEPDDSHGDGIVDMKDFRRVRDALLWVQGRRAHLGTAMMPGRMKMDLNEDGLLTEDDSAPEIYPRFDFDGDGALTPADVAQLAMLAAEDWNDGQEPPVAALPQLISSGDLIVDATPLFTAGATKVTVRAAGSPYSITLTPDAKVKRYTVSVGEADPSRTFQLTAEVEGGPPDLTLMESLEWGQRKPITLDSENVIDVAAGHVSACALTSKGAVWCWGNNMFGQLGHGVPASSAVPVRVTGITSGATAVSVGGGSACAVVRGGIMCWGTGGLGDGTTTTSLVPVQVSGITSGATAVAAGGTTLAVVNGAVVWWGGWPRSAVPVPVAGLESGMKAVSVGVSNCALGTAGNIVCWGNFANGTLGVSNDLTLTPIAGLSGATSVSVATASIYTTTADGGWHWLGKAPSLTDCSPQGPTCCGPPGSSAGSVCSAGFSPVAGAPSDAISTSTYGGGDAGFAACALTRAGAVTCWGRDWYNDGAPGGLRVPTTIIASGATAVSVGAYFGCAVVTGDVQCWGPTSIVPTTVAGLP